MLKEIKFGLKIASNPEKEFHSIHKQTFDEVLYYYIKLLVGSAIMAAIWAFLFSLGTSIYYQIFLGADVQYWRLINYYVGRSVSIAFLFIFLGTFILFVIASIFKIFFRKIEFLDFLKIVFYASTPLLLFAWTLVPVYALFLWSLFVFYVGVKSYKKDTSKKGTIRQRD